MPSFLRPALSLIAAALFATSPAVAFTAPLSDEAVREAYFLGQRGDDFMNKFIDEKYTKHLPPPKTGPNVASIAFLTPFARVAQLSGQNSLGYSAQKAAQDYRGKPDFVKIVVQVQFMDSYSWTDFQVQVFDKHKFLEPASSHGQTNSICSYEGGCTVVGATLELEFPASAFVSDSVTVQVDPPEGDQVVAEINHSALR